jgi:glycosyltransferase involved in cell wall biosynthesis
MSNLTNPLVSVIVRTKDRKELLKKALRSIAFQTYRPIEVILVNDGGQDLNLEELKNILEDVTLNYIRLENNKGRPYAGNVGLKNASGEFIGFLDDDDEFFPEHIEALVKFLINSNYGAAYTDSLYLFQERIGNEYVTVKEKVLFSDDYNYQKLLISNYIPILNILFKKELLSKTGLFDEDLDVHEDWDLWIRLGQYTDFYHIKKITAKVYMKDDGTTVTSANRTAFLRTARRIHKKYSHLIKDSTIKDAQGIVEWSLIKEVVEREERLQNKYILNIADDVIHEKDCLIKDLKSEIEKRDLWMRDLETELKRRDIQIVDLETELKRRDIQIGDLETNIKEKDVHVSDLKLEIMNLNNTLNSIYSSHGWKALLIYYKVRDRLLPVNTKRRKIVKSLWNFLNKAVGLPKLLKKEHAKKSFFYIKHYGFRVFLKKAWSKLNSKNIIFPHIPRVPNLELPSVTVDADNIITHEDGTVSVIIPTKNAGGEFRLLLSTLRNQKGLKDIEIIVVDSGSNDETIEIAKAYKAKIIEIPPEKFSHAYSRNTGAENASGKYLFFTVQDALPPTEFFLYELLNELKNSDVKAVSCAEFPREDADLFYRISMMEHAKFLEVDKGNRILSQPENEDYINLRKNAQLTNIACLIPKEIFMEYKFRGPYAEDLDLGIRLIKDGHKLKLLNSIKIIHSHNRPPFYFLKRGYVDVLFFATSFKGFPTLVIDEQDLFRDILLSHNMIASFIDRGLNTIKTPINVKELFNVLNKIKDFKYHNSFKSDYPYVDENFKLFLKEIWNNHLLDKEEQTTQGALIYETLGFLETARDYIVLTYPFIENDILEDIKAFIFKIYAYKCGEYLAYCHLNGNLSIKNLHNLLKEGI